MTRWRSGLVCLAALPLGAMLLWPAGSALAQPTPEEVLESINNGVAWLASQQAADGSWSASWEPVAVTGLAVKKLEHHAVDPVYGLGLPSPFDDSYAYKMHVESGLQYLFRNAYVVPIGLQPHGDPDTDGDGLGIGFGIGPSWHHEMYTTGIALLAICQAVDLDRVVETGPLAGRTYEDVARDTMDYLLYGQNDFGWPRGGWGYYANYGVWSDNSNSGWTSLGLSVAEASPPEGCGFTIPQAFKDELNIWTTYIQTVGGLNDGGSGYTAPDEWVNTLKTGNLLAQIALGQHPDSDIMKAAALDYLDRHWDVPNQDPGWRGWAGISNYQATFALMKGFQAHGITEFGEDPDTLEPRDWQADFEEELVAEQNPDGSWPRADWDFSNNRELSTAWALLTLEKAAPVIHRHVPVDIKPQSCPNPLNIGSKGVLPVAILGTEDFDVTQVDPATVRLSIEEGGDGVAPLRWAMEDVATPYGDYPWEHGEDPDAYDCHEEGADGYMDLTLKFSRQEVVGLDLTSYGDGAVLVLHVSGNLKEEFGGTPIMGEDVILILSK